MARKPPKGPSTSQKMATVWAAEQNLKPWQVATGPSEKPKPVVLKPSPKGKPPSPVPRASLDTRYKAALAAPVSRKARVKLSTTMAPARRADLIRSQRPIIPPPPPPGFLRRAIHPFAQGLGWTGAAVAEVPNVFRYLDSLGGTSRPGGMYGGAALTPLPPLPKAKPQPAPYGGAFERRGKLLSDFVEALPRTIPSLAKVAAQGTEQLGGKAAGWLLGEASGLQDSLARQGGGLQLAPGATPSKSLVRGDPSQAALAPEALGKMAANVAALGAGGVVGGVEHPLRAFNDGVNILSGTTQAIVGVPFALLNPKVTDAQRATILKTFAHDFIHQLASEFGPNITLHQAFSRGQHEPVNAVLTAIAVAEPGLKAIDVIRFMQEGATLSQALKLARDPALSEEILGRDNVRMLRYRGKESSDFTIGTTRSRSATGRLIQNLYDPATAGLEHVPILRDLPVVKGFTQSARALRVMGREARRDEARLKADGTALMSEVRDALKKDDPNDELGMGARLTYELQKPADVPTEAWLTGIRNDMQEMLDGRAAIREGKKSPREIQLENEVARFGAKVEQLQVAQDALAATLPRAPSLAPPRAEDLSHATDYLGTEQGSRTVVAAQAGDVEATVTQLLNQSVNDVATSHPEDWAAVEALRGKPLAQWQAEDYRWLSGHLESFTHDQIPPTIESGRAFRLLARQMRTYYGGLHAASPGGIAANVARVFETHFGAYDDPAVHANSTWAAGEIELQRAKGVYEQSSKELQRLRLSRDTRAFNRSIEGLSQRIDALTAKGDLSLAEQEELARLSADRLVQQAAQTAAEIDRESGMRERLAEIDKALANPQSRRYEGALASLAALTDARKAIMLRLFGDHLSVFENRADLLGDWLVDRGFLEPFEEKGTAHYVGHRSASLAAKGQRQVSRPSRPLVEGQSIGPPSAAKLNLHHQNQLLRYQNGDLNVDPEVVFADWMNAQSFFFLHGLSDRLIDVARPLNVNETVPETGVYILNRSGSPVPELNLKVRPAGVTDSIQKVLDSIDGHDEAATEEVLTNYVKDMILTPEEARKRVAENDPAYLDLYVIDKRIVDAITRPLKGASNAVGESWDFANSLARFSMIYANPAYAPTNFLANTFLLLGQQGPWAASNLIRASKMALKNSKLGHLIDGEVGETRTRVIRQLGRHKKAEGPIRRGSERFEQIEQGAAELQTVGADVIPRRAAWIYEARRLGYRTEDQLFELLRGKGSKSIRDRQTVADRSNEVMVNFGRLSDWERQNLTRYLFIWPWIRGATAWPFYYAKEFPIVTGAVSNLAEPAEERRKRLLGPNTKTYYRGMFPIEGKGRTAEEINVTAFSPTDTAAQSVETIGNLIRSLVLGDQLPKTGPLMDYINPMVELSINLITGQDAFGQAKPGRDLLIDNMVNFIPLGGMGRQLIDPSKASPAFQRSSALDIIARKMARILPEDVDVIRLQQKQVAAGRKTITERTNDSLASLQKQVSKLGGGTMPIPNSVRRAISLQATYEEAVQAQKDKIKNSPDWQPSKVGQTEVKLTDQQTAWIAYEMYRRYVPAATRLLRPDQLRNPTPDLYAYYTRALLYGNQKEGVDGLFGPLEEYRREIQKAKKAG